MNLNFSQCFSASCWDTATGLGRDYNGKVNQTADGIECQVSEDIVSYPFSSLQLFLYTDQQKIIQSEIGRGWMWMGVRCFLYNTLPFYKVSGVIKIMYWQYYSTNTFLSWRWKCCSWNSKVFYSIWLGIDCWSYKWCQGSLSWFFKTSWYL